MSDATHIPAGEPLERIQCQWCQGMNEKTALTCRACGAPLDIRNLVSESGWREAPRLKDMTEFQFNSSTCQVEGEIVPVAEINLGHGDSIYFEHHIMLWKDDAVPLSVLQLAGRNEARICRHAVHHQRGHRAGPHRILARRNRRAGSAAAASRHGTGCARARVPAGVAPDRLLLRAHQRAGEYYLRRPGHVHGPLRHHQHVRAC